MDVLVKSVSDIPQIEIYPIKMLRKLIDHKLVDPLDLYSVFIFSSSYEGRLWELAKIYDFPYALYLQYRQSESPDFADSFSEKMADQIAEKLELSTNRHIYLCCDDGQTRSAGIMAALYWLYGLDENMLWESPHVQPNTLVYHLLQVALGEHKLGYRRIARIVDIRALINLNEKAFSKAVNQGTYIDRKLYFLGLNSRVTQEKKKKYFEILKKHDKAEVENALLPDGGTTIDPEEYELLKEVVTSSIAFKFYYEFDDNGAC